MMTLIQNIVSLHLLHLSASFSYWKTHLSLSYQNLPWVLILPIKMSNLGMLSLGLSTTAVASQALLPNESIPDANFWRLP